MNGFKYIRKKILKCSMDELADKLGVSKQMIYTWEHRKKPIPKERLKQLSKLSGSPKSYFLLDELSEEAKLSIDRYKLENDMKILLPNTEIEKSIINDMNRTQKELDDLKSSIKEIKYHVKMIDKIFREIL